MARRKKVYEGKAKILYEGPEPGTLIQYFKDDSAPTVAAPAALEGKGVLNNRLSEFFMSGLNLIGVPTHFIRRINMREQLVRMAEIIPLEVVVRNYSAGPMTARLGIPEGTQLPRPIVEYYYKDEKLGSPLVSEEHIVAFGWANHHRAGAARQRFPVRRDDWCRHPSGRFPHRGRSRLGRRLHAPDRGG
jgi:phosphoribosylaminoimidazole-succinocarboxamide synthase